ncbi:unnamed protein product [Cyclocybe aegerita]|uniref:Uncharacterized protein n=1 Tax=Cyclocybe aegerita TaxID=1973307 RepID=A0A8S0VTR9_CYCAE|nr:unnamed protein product [Cyclocybe aegerita]
MPPPENKDLAPCPECRSGESATAPFSHPSLPSEFAAKTASLGAKRRRIKDLSDDQCPLLTLLVVHGSQDCRRRRLDAAMFTGKVGVCATNTLTPPPAGLEDFAVCLLIRMDVEVEGLKSSADTLSPCPYVRPLSCRRRRPPIMSFDAVRAAAVLSSQLPLVVMAMDSRPVTRIPPPRPHIKGTVHDIHES